MRHGRLRLFLFITTMLAFIAGFTFAWNVLNPMTNIVESDGNGMPLASSGTPCDVPPGRFVGLHDGHVAVFNGIPGGCHEPVELEVYPEDELLPFQVPDLRQGIVFRDEDELFQILEGLRAP